MIIYYYYYCCEMSEQEYSAQLKVPFSTSEEAKIAFTTLNVDCEPRKELIKRDITLDSSSLIVNWSSKEARLLRVSVNSFLDHLTSVVETLHEFGTEQ